MLDGIWNAKERGGVHVRAHGAVLGGAAGALATDLCSASIRTEATVAAALSARSCCSPRRSQPAFRWFWELLPHRRACGPCRSSTFVVLMRGGILGLSSDLDGKLGRSRADSYFCSRR
jgi:hypothetical protein